MKTYILKYDVYNSIDFPKGTIVKQINEKFYKFEVVEGDLKGEKGDIADGLSGWLLEDTPENRKILADFLNEKERIEAQIKDLNKRWGDLPAAVINL
jgi:hypothetical protein